MENAYILCEVIIFFQGYFHIPIKKHMQGTPLVQVCRFQTNILVQKVAGSPTFGISAMISVPIAKQKFNRCYMQQKVLLLSKLIISDLF